MYLLRVAFPLLLMLCAVAQAEETPLTYDRINLSFSADRDVENDTLIAVMYAQEEGTDPARLAAEVNGRVAAAVERVHELPAVRVQTLDYSTSPLYRNQVLTGWRVRQSIRLESRDAAVLGQLIGNLQSQLGVSSIVYELSPERRNETEGQLISEAIGGFTQRANMVTEQMGRSGYRLVHLNITTAGNAPRPYPMRSMEMAMAADAAPPAIEAGTRRVEVRVDGTIELKP